MSKHDTITKNLLTLTHSRSFVKAVDDWFVKKLVTLSKQQQSCELCGTLFRQGAVVAHRRSKATVLVGGTCLKTLQAHRFPKRFKFKLEKQLTLTKLRTHYRHYGPLIDPGNWLLWMRNNAPPRLVQVVSDLLIFGATTDSDQLQKLIRFHDTKRLFPRSALLTNPRALERALQIKIAEHITIVQAQQLEARAETTSAKEKPQIAASKYLEEPQEKNADLVIRQLEKSFHVKSFHVRRVDAWLGFLVRGIQTIKDSWWIPRSRRLFFQAFGRRYKVAYRHDAAPRGGIVIIEVDDIRGQPEIGSPLVVIASLDDARDFFVATQTNWRDRPDRFHDDANRFRALMRATVGRRSAAPTQQSELV